jgi:hypothetical protein
MIELSFWTGDKATDRKQNNDQQADEFSSAHVIPHLRA